MGPPRTTSTVLVTGRNADTLPPVSFYRGYGCCARWPLEGPAHALQQYMPKNTLITQQFSLLQEVAQGWANADANGKQHAL
jgi:hypothetical protein